MNLKEYLKSSKDVEFLVRELSVPAPLISQWKHAVRPVPVIRCVQIEKATEGAVTRRDLRPDDWHEIWPELVDVI